MKLRTLGLVMFSAGMIAAAGCKKKPKEQKAPPDPGSNTMSGTGAGSGSGTMEPPKEAKLEGKGLADKYVECTGYINGQKWDDFKSKCISADYKGHEMDGQEIPNADAVIEWFKSQAVGFPDMKVEPQAIMVSDRNILAVALITGTHTGTLKTPMGDIPATNKKIGQLMYHRLTINDENRASEEWAYFDPATMMFQLGLLPKEAGPMRPAMEKGLEGAPMIGVSAGDDKEKANMELVKKGNDAFLTKKPADFMAMYADDAVESDQASEKDTKGKKDIEAGAMMFIKAFPDLKLETSNMFAAGDYVIFEGKWSGTNDGPMGPMKPTKKKVEGNIAEIYKIKDGKFAEVWRFRNGLSMMMQLGMMPEPKPPGDGSAAGGSADMKK